MDFDELVSMVRNNRVAELEAFFDSSDERSFSVNSVDPRTGNSLLLVACQNGNKRVVKMLLRRGAALNHRNNRGNSCLHFAYFFGFTELGEYLISKGADDSKRNSEGLTCYEGVSRSSLEAL